MPMRRSFVRRPMTRRRRHWLWIRSQANSVTPIAAPNFQTIDLLANYRSLAGIDLNLPEFTIWRIRIKISVRFTLTPPGAFESNSGITVASFVDNMAATYTNPVLATFDEQYLLWDTMFAFKSLSQGAPIATNEVAMYQEYDLKGRRRLGNIGDTLLFQLAPTANGEILNYSYQQVTLCLLRN